MVMVMKDKIRKLIDIASILHPDYAKSFNTVMEEYEYFEKQVNDITLRYTISLICTQTPIMLEVCPEEHRLEIEKLLLSQLDADCIH